MSVITRIKMEVDYKKQFDDSIKKAITAVVNADIKEFRTGMRDALNAKIIDKSYEIRNQTIRDMGFVVNASNKG